MTNMVIQHINIADYENIFVMPITSNYRLIIINGPSNKWELSGFRTEGHVWPKLEANILLWKKLKGTRFFLGRFEILKKV